MRMSNVAVGVACAATWVCAPVQVARAQEGEAAKAAPQVDEQAKAILLESAAAIKALKGATYTGSRSLEGQSQFTMKTDGEVKFIRNEASPSTSALWVKGRMTPPMQAERDVLAAFAEGVAVWADYNNNVVLERKAVAPDTVQDVKRVKDQLIPDVFFEREPYEKMLRTPEITLVGVEEVNGEKCQVIKTWNAPVQRGAKIAVSMNDRLPRRLEFLSGFKGAKDGMASFTLNITNLKLAPGLTPADLKVETPAGFSRRADEVKKADVKPESNVPFPRPPGMKEGQTPTPTPTPAADAGQAPPPAQKAKPTGVAGGFPPGTVAPAWVLKGADGSEQKLAGHSGKVVVMAFWGPLFTQSKAANQTLDEVAKAVSGKNVSTYSVVCRDPGKRANDLMKQWGSTVPLLLEGDQTAKDYQVQGYPSFVVINGEGKIAAFFQGATGKDALLAAVDAAGAK